MNRRHILIGGAALSVAGAGAAYAGWQRMSSMTSYDNEAALSRPALVERPELRDLVRYATLAANSHNTQAWRFKAGDNRIDILPDFSRRTPIVDPDDHHLFVSLGCACENLKIAAGARGRPGQLGFDASNDGAATFTFAGASDAEPELCDAIVRRQSTRADYDGRAVSAETLRALQEAAAVPGVDLVLFTDRPSIDRVRDLVLAGNSAQMADPVFITELKRWLRFSPRQAALSGDGLFSAASGSPALPNWAGPMFFDAFVTEKSENDRYARQLRSSSGIAIFVSHQDDRDHWFRAGRACQRFALKATSLGLVHAFINQPVEVAGLRPELAALAGLPGRRPDLVMRFGYGPKLPFSARRPVEAVWSA